MRSYDAVCLGQKIAVLLFSVFFGFMCMVQRHTARCERIAGDALQQCVEDGIFPEMCTEMFEAVVDKCRSGRSTGKGSRP